MIGRTTRWWATAVSLLAVAILGSVPPAPAAASEPAVTVPAGSGSSVQATWSCTSSPCPWGDSTSGQAIAWPASASPVNNRLGYTVSQGVYLPAAAANGLTITLQAGGATAYAGTPNADGHRLIGSVPTGGSLTITNLAPDEVLSIQSGGTFTYTFTYTTEPATTTTQPTTTTEPAAATTTTTTTEPATTTTTQQTTTTTTTEPTAASTTTTEPATTVSEPAVTVPAGSGSSVQATWSCTSSPCPWGDSTSGQAIAWPASASPVNNRLGYTVSQGVYLPAAAANGLTITLQAGGATAYAGTPNADGHRLIGSVPTGGSLTITNLAPDEVLSIQSGGTFTYTFTYTTEPATTTTQPTTTTEPAAATTTTTTTEPATTTTTQQTTTTTTTEPTAASTTTTEPATTVSEPAVTVPAGSGSSVQATWSCTSSPCPWGDSTSGQAIAWPASASPVNNRLGYTVSQGVYLPAAAANGLTITLQAGGATAYAGTPNADGHRLIGSVPTGGSLTITNLAPDEVLSIQSGGTFTYTFTYTTEPATTTTQPTTTTEPAAATTTTTTTEPATSCNDPLSCEIVEAELVHWRCNLPGCTWDDWHGAAIGWPAWSAYSTNSRTGYNSRTTYTERGELTHPYMGAWADGCEVTARSGRVLIIEWRRGTDVWRETLLDPGQSHVIDLIGSEDNAMIETDGYSKFSVSLQNCTPELLPDL